MMKLTLRRRAVRASERIAIAAGAVMVSPASFWVLLVLCLLQLVSAKVATDVLYVSNDIQLLLLPLLGISQAVSAGKAARQARRDQESLERAFVEISEQLGLIKEIVEPANGVRVPWDGAGLPKIR
jgi:hypothetical protein